MKEDRRHSPSRLPDLSVLAEQLRTFARRSRALPLLYIEFSAHGRARDTSARQRSAIYKQATAAALKSSIGSVLRQGDLVAAGAGGTWFIALLTARPNGSRSHASDADLGIAAERLRRTVQLELARTNTGRTKSAAPTKAVTVRCGWNVLEPASDPLEGLRHAVRGAALVARIEERRATVLAAVTHELRTPLTAIVGFAERLQNERSHSAQAKRYLDIIIDESKRLQRLAEGLIDIGSWSSGNLRLQLEPHGLAAIAAMAAQAVAERATHKQVTIKVSGDAAALVDHDRCLQIIINLLDNAVRYSPQGAQVNIALKKRGQTCTLSIADMGRGFGHLKQDAAGLPFAAGFDGRTGLGLSITRLLVEAHGGTFSLVKRRRGGMVAVTLPAADSRHFTIPQERTRVCE